MICKFSNTCLDCMECIRQDFTDCKAYKNYVMQELKQTPETLFYIAEPDLFNNSESEGQENDSCRN